MKGNREYLDYLKIEAIRTSLGDKVYIPTEALLPITEAKIIGNNIVTEKQKVYKTFSFK